MKINEVLFRESLDDVEFQPTQTTTMKQNGNEINTNMDDPSTSTLVRNKQTKKLEVIEPGQTANKAQYDNVDDGDEQKQKQVQVELEKQKKEQEREAQKATLNARRVQNQTQQQSTTTGV